MAKADEKSDYPYPSRFGSHKSMLVDEATLSEDEKALMPDLPGDVVCKDEFGLYRTFRYRLDSKQSDAHRYDFRRNIVEKINGETRGKK